MEFSTPYEKKVIAQVFDELWVKDHEDGEYKKVNSNGGGSTAKANWNDLEQKPSFVASGESEKEARDSIGAISMEDVPAMPNEDKLVPSGGATGQILKKTATGSEWANEKDTTYDGMTQAVATGATSEVQQLISSKVLNDTIGGRITAVRGQPNGLASLDASGTVPMEQLNISSLAFKGGWNATTNTPTLVDGTGAVGDFYKVSVAGTYNFGNGDYTFQVGDWVMYAGGTWQRIGVHESVTSVNGQTGAVVIPEAAVKSVNGQVGDVVITAPDAPVRSVNGQTGDVVIPNAPVQSVNGKTGAVSLSAADVSARASNWNPTWDNVLNKPNIITKRGSIGPAIPAFSRRSVGSQTFANKTYGKVNVFTGAGFDEFSIQGSDPALFTIPSWASYFRVSMNLLMSSFPTGTNNHVFVRLLQGSSTIGSALQTGIGNDSRPSIQVSSGIIVPASTRVVSAEIWQSTGGGNLSSSSVSEAWNHFTIELYE